MNIKPTILILSLLVVNLFAQEAKQDLNLLRASHPHTPYDLKNIDATFTEDSLTPENEVKNLVKQEQWLTSQLKRFPVPRSQTSPPQQQFGFLCPMDPSSKEEWIELKFSDNNNIKFEGVALIPAIYSMHSTLSNYRFPKRFKIEGFDINKPNTPIIIADWTKQDFPDPGVSPVIFDSVETFIHKIRLTVTKGHSDNDKSFFALDELLIFRNGINISPPIANQLSSSNSYDIPPYWHLKYLVDGKTHLGKAFSAKPDSSSAETMDFFLDCEPEQDATQAEEFSTIVTIDLDTEYSIGRVELYPAHDSRSPIPAISLPQEYELQLLSSLEPEIITKSDTISTTHSDEFRYHPLYSHSGRYIRFIFNKLPIHNGKQTLAIGEIRIIGDEGDNQGLLELNKQVTISSIKGDILSQINTNTSPLVDGLVNGLYISSEKTYIEQLAKRALVERAHHSVLEKITVAKAVRSQRYWTIGISLAAILSTVLVLLTSRFKRKVEQGMTMLQKQIAADLHDDISGNLGTISMISNRVNKLTLEPRLKEKLKEIDHLSQESYISLKEIIWHTDSKVVRLSDLMKQIQRTAQSVSNDCQIHYDFPTLHDEYEDLAVPVKIRRNIILLAKEALFNCAKYAQAKNIYITAQITPSLFTLIMRDDGCGFDSSKGILTDSQSGRGLLNMEQRAKLLDAELNIQSTIDKGTEIHFKMPLSLQKI